MRAYETDLGPRPHESRWRAAQRRLQAGRVRIAHVDTGLAPHPALGFTGDTPPPNIALAEGRNFHESPAGHQPPVTTLARGAGFIARLTEYPDHGLKTLAIILADGPKLRGVAPGAHVVPYRVANGPVFRGDAKTAAIGSALAHAMALPNPPRVVSISMGNPGFMGGLEGFRRLLSGETVMAKSTREALDAAYEAGVIVVCAAGQVIEGVVYPARFARTIAVAGFDMMGATCIHYPRGGYDDTARVDVWARAEGINRPGAHLGDDGAPVWTYAAEAEDVGGEPSGTSYACPQVAAAAALWIETHHDALEKAFGRPADRWKITEAFRKALNRSARIQVAQDAQGNGKPGEIRVLDIEALLDTPPDPEASYRKRGRCVDAGVW